MDAPAEFALEAEGVSKSFPGVRALDGVGLRVRPGRLLAVLGENGAGKSTLMNILAGVFPPDTGTIRLAGSEVRWANPREARARGVSIVFQELSLIPHLSVAENIFLGREPCARSGLIDYRQLHADTAALLQRLDLRVAPTTPVARLRVGQQQIVEIARAVSTEARVLILDEPTSSLSEHEVDVLFGIIADLKRRGVAILYITHKFEELARIGDDVVILRDGRLVGAGAFGEFPREAIVRLMAGRETSAAWARTAPTGGDELLRVEAFSLRRTEAGRNFLFEDVSLSVRRGEVLGLFGLIGAGRTELLEAIFGLHAARVEGRMWMDGEPVSFGGPAQAIAAGMVLAPEDRKRDGLVLELGVAANASLASLDQALRAGFVSREREAAVVAPYLSRFRVKLASLGQPVRTLSGGNQQKVILAKWLATNPRVLLLDEPTRGIDLNAKREIYAFIDELARTGLAIVVVSSELPEVLALADRVVVLCEGRKTAEFSRSEVTAEAVLHAALPAEKGARSDA